MLGALGQMFGQAPPYVKHFISWLSRLQEKALVRWTPIAMQNIACGYSMGPTCVYPAISICHVCRTPTCLDHALVARDADVVCVKCINSLLGTKAPHQPPRAPSAPKEPPTIEEQRKHHFKTLKMRETATIEEVKSKYKRLALKHHPDKGGEAEEFNRITRAYQWIIRVHFAQ